MNRFDIPLPRIEGAQSEIVVAAWLKQPGDSVRAGEIVAEVSTDKVNVEIASPVTGVLEAILAGEGATVVEGTLLARVVLPAAVLDDSFDSLVIRCARLLLERRSHTRTTAALHTHRSDPRLESIELDAYFVHPFRHVRNRHRSPADDGSIEQYLCVSRTRHDFDRAAERRGRRSGRLWSWSG
jgi:pyruvate/2-oxoglutarate dehydrogenase complex dihydrolipoamide acyltransferase (E2) component